MDQVLRFVFKSGAVAERRGNDETVALSFELDESCLIDYVLSMEIETGECAFFTRDDDDRNLDEVVLTLKPTWAKDL